LSKLTILSNYSFKYFYWVCTHNSCCELDCSERHGSP